MTERQSGRMSKIKNGGLAPSMALNPSNRNFEQLALKGLMRRAELKIIHRKER